MINKKIINLLVLFMFASSQVLASSSSVEGNIKSNQVEGNSGISGCIIPNASSLDLPEDLMAEPLSTSSIKVTWDFHSENSHFSKFELWRASDSAFAQGATKIYEGKEYSYENVGLTAETEYYYKARAIYNYSDCGSQDINSSFSDTINTMTLANAINMTGFTYDDQKNSLIAGDYANFSENNSLFTNSEVISGSVLGSKDIDLPSSGILKVPLIMKSVNEVKDNDVNYKVELYIPSNTSFYLAAGGLFTGQLSTPNLVSKKEASSLSGGYAIVNVVQAGKKNTSINLSGGSAIILIPANGYNSSAQMEVKYSTDSKTWTTLGSYKVIMIESKPYIKITVTHFTYFAAVKALSECNESQLDITRGTCSCTSYTKTSSSYNIKSAYVGTCQKPSKTYTTSCTPSGCSSSNNGGSSGGGGGGGGGSDTLSKFVKDTCPAGDNSGNLYDGKCEKNSNMTGSSDVITSNTLFNSSTSLTNSEIFINEVTSNKNNPNLSAKANLVFTKLNNMLALQMDTVEFVDIIYKKNYVNDLTLNYKKFVIAFEDYEQKKMNKAEVKAKLLKFVTLYSEYTNLLKQTVTYQKNTINGISYTIMKPNYNNVKISATVDILNNKIISILKSKNGSQENMIKIISHYNNILFSLKIYQEIDKIVGKKLAQKNIVMLSSYLKFISSSKIN